MIRLTLILAIVIFAVLVLVPGEDPAPREIADARQTARPGALLDESALRETDDGSLTLVTETGEALAIDLVIQPSDLTEADARVDLPPAETSGGIPDVTSEARIEAGDAAPDDAAAEGPVLLQVTGDTVNFRAGPSTGDEILAALPRGTEVELIERVADGWAHLRVSDTGLEGYMSGDFLAPAN
jgi:hypothetical protein